MDSTNLITQMNKVSELVGEDEMTEEVLEEEEIEWIEIIKQEAKASEGMVLRAPLRDGRPLGLGRERQRAQSPRNSNTSASSQPPCV